VHPQLRAIVADFDAARDRLHTLAAEVPDRLWTLRPSAERWSIAECVAHLNLTAQAFLPLLDDALARAPRLDPPASRRLRRDLVGWLLWTVMGPPVRTRTRTAGAFVPASDLAPRDVVAVFDRLQEAQAARARAADGLAIDRVRIVSPFNARVKYNLYAALTILPRHQHRHLWQAEQARRTITDSR
jgi:hypothetical protein